MYLSKLFIPILKETPAEAKIKSHQLMLRTGMIKQSSTGIYSWLPLGFKIMKKIEQIVREEQNLIEAIRTNCRKTVKEKTGKRPYTNVNLVRI